MKKHLGILKNKYLLAFCIFFVYAVFLDDVDIFMILRKQSKLRQLEKQKIELSSKLEEISEMQQILENTYSLEKFAREERYFHKEDEDVFVIDFK
jgi:hypothetical protein